MHGRRVHAGERLPGVPIHHTGLQIARGPLGRRGKNVVQVYAGETPETREQVYGKAERRTANVDEVD